MEIVEIFFDENGFREFLTAERLGDDVFLINENSFFNRAANKGTKVKAQKDNSGQWIFEKVVEVSSFETRYFTIYTTPPFLPDILEEFVGKPILEAGGDWEIVMGSLAIISIPRNSNFDLDRLLNELGYNPSEWK